MQFGLVFKTYDSVVSLHYLAEHCRVFILVAFY